MTKLSKPLKWEWRSKLLVSIPSHASNFSTLNCKNWLQDTLSQGSDGSGSTFFDPGWVIIFFWSSGKVGSATSEFENFPQKYQFVNFSLWVQTNLIRLGQKISGSKVGQPPIWLQVKSMLRSDQGLSLSQGNINLQWLL